MSAPKNHVPTIINPGKNNSENLRALPVLLGQFAGRRFLLLLCAVASAAVALLAGADSKRPAHYDHGWLGHTGSLPGYTTSVFYLPEKQATITVLTNSDISIGGVGPSAAIFKALAAIATPRYVPTRG